MQGCRFDGATRKLTKEGKRMNIGDRVVPLGFKDKSKPGRIKMICGKTAVVTWIMGSGWGHTVSVDLENIEKV